MALFDFKGYDNEVLEDKILSILSTKLDMNKFMTPNYSLEAHPGMVWKVHKYVGSGQVDDLERGEGNTHFIDAEYSEEEYRVARTQGQIRFYDDDQLTDPVLIDTKVKALSESMVNDWTKKAMDEYAKTLNTAAFTDWKLANWADAIAKYANVYESQEGLFCLCSMDLVPTIRKALGEDLKYVEDYIRTGAIGSVLGVPIYTSKALPNGIMYLATKDAVTAFVKKGVFVEQDRNIDTKLNNIVAARYSVIALTDESKCIMCGKAPTTACSISTYTKAAKTIAGACDASASKVVVYVNGAKEGEATLSSGSWTISAAANLAEGDVVKAIAYQDEKIPSVAEVTVA